VSSDLLPARRHLPLLHRAPEVRDPGHRAIPRGRRFPPGRWSPVHLLLVQPGLLPPGLLRRVEVPRGVRRRDVLGGRPPISPDARGPPERGGPALPPLARDLEEPPVAQGDRLPAAGDGEPFRLEGRGPSLPV